MMVHTLEESPYPHQRHTIRLQLAIGLGASLAIGALWLVMPSLFLVLGIALAPIAIITVLRVPFILCVSFTSLSFTSATGEGTNVKPTIQLH